MVMVLMFLLFGIWFSRFGRMGLLFFWLGVNLIVWMLDVVVFMVRWILCYWCFSWILCLWVCYLLLLRNLILVLFISRFSGFLVW